MSNPTILSPALLAGQARTYTVDLSADLAELTITTATFSLVDAQGCTLGTQAHSTTSASVTVTGGPDAASALIKLDVTASDGSQFDWLYQINVEALQIAALVLETGQALPNSDSYVPLSEADIFWASRGETAWTQASIPARIAALRNASEYLNFGFAWKGQPTKTTQALAWPRAGAVDYYGYGVLSTIIPPAVRKAQILLAREALAVDLLKGESRDSLVVQESVTVGALTESKRYVEPANKSVTLPNFPAVDAMLIGLATSATARSGMRTVKLVRA